MQKPVQHLSWDAFLDAAMKAGVVYWFTWFFIMMQLSNNANPVCRQRVQGTKIISIGFKKSIPVWRKNKGGFFTGK